MIDLAAVWRDVGRNPGVFDRGSSERISCPGPEEWAETRRLLQSASRPVRQRLLEPHLTPISDVQLHLPIEVADYVDFYALGAPRRQRGPDLPAGRGSG